jgi:hypothetical protein
MNASILAALANGIIPADARDEGAAAVNAGARLAEKVETGINAAIYARGVDTAEALAMERHGRSVTELDVAEIYSLLTALRESLPAFFKQLRMDVSALYLSDPGVWQRIGFPGPSIASGGYPDFGEPQTAVITQLKEPP